MVIKEAMKIPECYLLYVMRALFSSQRSKLWETVTFVSPIKSKLYFWGVANLCGNDLTLQVRCSLNPGSLELDSNVFFFIRAQA